MSQYIERYEQKRRLRINSNNQQLLKQLSSNTLFCKYCFQPFPKYDHIKTVLTTPYEALLDLISAVTFVVIPIIWIPLILLFAILAVFEYFAQSVKKKNDETEYYSHSQFDKEFVVL